MDNNFSSTRRQLLAASLGALSVGVHAQPNDAIRLIVPYPPGGVMDALARPLAAHAQARLGPIIVDDVAGLRGSTGTELVANAAADGRTLLMGSIASHVINYWSGASKLYDPVRDFSPIALLARAANALVLSPASAQQLGIGDLADLIELARKRPGKLTYGSIGVGSLGHLAGELFKQRLGLNIRHRPYAGVNPAQAAMLAGEVDFGFLNVANCAVDVQAGRLRALAVTTLWRAAQMPDVPTLNESPVANGGLAGFDLGAWIALFGPANMSRDLVLKLNAAFVNALDTPELRTVLDQLQLEASPSTPEQLGALVRADKARLRSLVRLSKARL